MTAAVTRYGGWRSWRRWAPAAAGGWAWFLVAMGVFWSVGGAGYPFGRNDRTGPDYSSLLAGLESPVGGPLITGFGLVALVVAGQLDGPARRQWARRLVLAAGVGIAALIVGVVLDARMIVLLPPLGFLPIGWLRADWPTVFQVVAAVGAALFLLASTAYAGRTGGKGRPAPGRRAAWVRVGRIATYVAMVCPLPYAVIRLAWSRGWALGAPQPFVASLLRNQPENVYIEPTLAAFAIGGVVLTCGLLCRWGRVFPRWMPVLRGRVVPLWFPLLLGGSAVVAIFAFGRGLLLGQLGVRLPGQLDTFQLWGEPVYDPAYWGAGGLGWVLFPLWSISLAVALAGYHHRYASAGPVTSGTGPAGRLEAEAGDATHHG
ncbi:hypothetical protein O7634_29180 [Micromonospora sp. WMMD1120]|uniref:hypothetical protein n=1 Tax=Micromonospora sp. WMMD1120 TaxID=3016106 RepID=UPI0024176D13|nr:hypothetical protein [Micromonospora sp. WMMD1120]MDG4810850.1 hypothetical protein [Micromonospora sp. WMMD1120]